MSNTDPIQALVANATREVQEAEDLLASTRRQRDAIIWALSGEGYGTFQRIADWTDYDGQGSGITAQSVTAAARRAPELCTTEDLNRARELVLEVISRKRGISMGSTPAGAGT